MSFDRTSFKRFAWFFALSMLSCGSLRAQGALGWPEWQQVANDIGGWTAIYFVDPLRGITALDDSTIQYIAWDTVLSEWRWERAQTPSGISFIPVFRSIQGKLYAASAGTDALVSTDSGRTWQFSGLGLNNANDIYADGNGVIRALTNPMISFARIDTMHCAAVGNGSVYISSDGGDRWITLPFPIDSASGGIFGDPCYHTFVCPSSRQPWGTDALRSTDSGQTWQAVVTGSGPVPQFIYGASTVPYVTSSSGLFRSIDDGQNWTSIITVNGGPHLMYVWGPMGEQVAMSWDEGDGIFMTTTGGDDNLHSAVAMTDSNGAPLMQDDTMNVPFQVVSQCNSFSIPVALEADVPGLAVTVSIVSNNPNDFSLLSADSAYFPTPVVNQHYVQDTFWLNYTPHNPIDTATLVFNNYWNCSAWTETRTVIIRSYPQAHIIPPATIAAECQPETEAAYVKLDSCSVLVIDSVTIPPNLASRIHIAPLPDTLRAGTNDSLYFTFDPTDTIANIFLEAELFAHFPGMDSSLAYFDFPPWLDTDSVYSSLTNIDQLLPLHLIALPKAALYSVDTEITLARPAVCSETLDSAIVFANKGCTSDTITQFGVSGTGYAVQAGAVPLIIEPDSTLTLNLLFTAPDTGTYSGLMNMTVVSGETRELFIPLTGVGFPPTGILSLPNPAIDAGSVSVCSDSMTLYDTLSNIGCDTLAITNLRIAGDPDFTLALSDTTIPPQSKLPLKITFDPFQKGPLQATVSFHSANADGSGVGLDTSLALSATGLHGTMFLASNVDSVDAGSTFLCQERDTFVVISDTGCDSVCVSSVTLDAPGFTITSGGGAFCLAPGESDTVRIHTQVDTTGGQPSNAATLTIVSNATNMLAPVMLTREIQYPVVWSLVLSTPDSALAGSEVTYEVMQTGPLPSDVDSIEFTLIYNDDLLRFDSVTEASAVPIGYNRSSDGLAHETFRIAPLGNGSVLVTLHFNAYVTSAAAGSLLLDSVLFYSSLGRSENCIATLSLTQSAFQVVQQCGTQELGDFLASGVVTVDEIVPNPAQHSMVVAILNGSHISQPAELSIVDALGRTVQQMPLTLEANAENQVPVIVESLPSGLYIARIRANGFISSKSFIKE